ncbi:helix-turn-helix transcriptional regulator [Dickeya solani]|uniref:AraC family transcriptional regulator n=1 Tax=Dickeya solani TaxID=1089444 RepID=A0AAX4F5A1_9GAMM|nr:AraC family transcriptional regulator [Dickeya solani]MCZ0819693.1 AraC family transcriptional regulator [Dickeya solani]MDV6993396.1 AraC family transcriptional regulator [Dickeya solani]MDV7003526.1 AraC family transcriptional regulator [Dickeya solani]MDV7036245.1 AraC family transcriptional regulator [Dickeya solani]MDV7041117.1 AraC family transcriptional regulator [Dickeya solani]
MTLTDHPNLPLTHSVEPVPRHTPAGPSLAHQIIARSQYTLRTVVMRTDLIGLVVSGTKQLLTPEGSRAFTPGELFILPRGTQWDVINDPAPQGRYVAQILSLQPETVTHFYQSFGQFAALEPVRNVAKVTDSRTIGAAFLRAADALSDAGCSAALSEHRVLEVLLLLAEQSSIVLTPPGALNWSERVRRLVAQRPYDHWSADRVAQALSTTASTLNRRLAQEDNTITACVRETRLEAAMVLLQSSDRPVAAIALDVGYESHSKFTAAFRRRFGVVPSALRG